MPRPVHASQHIAVCVLVCASAVFAQSAGDGSAFLDVQAAAPPMIGRIDGRAHLVYELHLTNFRPAAVTLTRIDVLHENALLQSSAGAELERSLARVGARLRPPDPQRLDGGQRAVFYAWFAVPHRDIPTEIRHRVVFHTDDGSERSVDAARVRIARDRPIELGPPLRGGPWVAVFDPGLQNGHRRALFAVDGRARIPARFAVDWLKLGPDGRLTHDDPSVPSNSYSYGEDVLAVADGLVAGIQNELAEPTPNISMGNEAGNYIALALGGNRFAFYEHLKPGSARVTLGERVRAGQILASVGASGSVSAGAHLHFHVADANALLAAEGLPFVLRRYERHGAIPSFDALNRPWTPAPGEPPTTRSAETPGPLTVVRFD